MKEKKDIMPIMEKALGVPKGMINTVSEAVGASKEIANTDIAHLPSIEENLNKSNVSFDSIATEALKLKGVVFIHPVELKDRLHCEDNSDTKIKVYFIDGIPFLKEDYNLTYTYTYSTYKGVYKRYTIM